MQPRSPSPLPLSSAPHPPYPPPGRLARWWSRLSPARQDRFAALAPAVAVLLFMVSVLASMGYLQMEEARRAREALARDAHEAHTSLRLRLMGHREQLQRMARYVARGELTQAGFALHVEALMRQRPELLAVRWLDGQGHLLLGHAVPGGPGFAGVGAGGVADRVAGWELRQQAGAGEQGTQGPPAVLRLHVPWAGGALLGEYSPERLLHQGVDAGIAARHALALVPGADPVPAAPGLGWLRPWRARALVWQQPLEGGVALRVRGWRASPRLVGRSLFGVTATMSVLTAWLLVANWRHLRRRRHAQAALLAETGFRRAMENSVLTGMRAMDLQGRVTYVNAAFCHMTGFAEEELVGRGPPYAYWPEEEHARMMALLRRKLAGENLPGGAQVRMQRKDGTQFDARLYISPLVDGRGRHTGWMTSMTDITEPLRTREQLAAAHQRFAVVLESLDAAVSVAPLGHSGLLFANRLYHQWFGRDAAGHLRLVAQAGAQGDAQGSVQENVQGGAGGVEVKPAGHPEVFCADLDLWLEVRSRYLHWVDGRLVQMVIASDVTARRRAQEQAARQADHAQAMGRLITMGEMASSVAHELNQPLAAISNYCNGLLARLQRGALEPDALGTALQKTAHQAQRAAQVIERIRQFVQRSAPERTQVAVAGMVQEAVELMQMELARRQVRLVTHLAQRMPPVLADAILIEQVLVNLMKNGMEAMDQARKNQAHKNQGVLELRVRPRVLEGGQEGAREVIEFVVEDSGCGLAPEVLERLFEAFFSTKGAGGMGMGLNLCRSIVESHQGRLHAENLMQGTQVTGCRFSFWLPVALPYNETDSRML